jgi:sec-independent protein translocase protein TatB
MFDVSFWNLCLVGIVALLVLRPEKLPRAARTAGLWIGKARRTLAEIQAEIERELDVKEIKRLNERIKPSSGFEHPDKPGEPLPSREPDPNVPSITAKQ